MVQKIKILGPIGNAVTGGTVSFIDKTTGETIAAFSPGGDGSFSIDTGLYAALYMPGVQIIATAPGYTQSGIDSSIIVSYNEWDFEVKKKPNLALILIAGIGLAGLVHVAVKERKQNKKVKGFDTLPPTAKTAIVLGGVGLGAYLIIKGSAGKNASEGLPTAANSQLQNLIASGNGPTISAAEAEGYAASLRTAFDDCGTDTNTVYSVFGRMQNLADILFLISVYGTRGYKGCFDGDYFGNHNYNLQEALTSELSSSEMAKLNTIISNAGITYNF